MAELVIATATLSFDVDGATAAVEYQAIDVNINYQTEAPTVAPMDTTSKGAFPGISSWSGSFSILADDTTGSPSPNTAIFPPKKGTLSFAMTDQTHTTPVVVTLSGAIVITGCSFTYNMTDVPVLEVTFLGSGALTEGQV